MGLQMATYLFLCVNANVPNEVGGTTELFRTIKANVPADVAIDSLHYAAMNDHAVAGVYSQLQ